MGAPKSAPSFSLVIARDEPRVLCYGVGFLVKRVAQPK